MCRKCYREERRIKVRGAGAWSSTRKNHTEQTHTHTHCCSLRTRALARFILACTMRISSSSRSSSTKAAAASEQNQPVCEICYTWKKWLNALDVSALFHRPPKHVTLRLFSVSFHIFLFVRQGNPCVWVRAYVYANVDILMSTTKMNEDWRKNTYIGIRNGKRTRSHASTLIHTHTHIHANIIPGTLH